MTATATQNPVPTPLNGFDTPTLVATAEQLGAQPALAACRFHVKSAWRDASRVQSRTLPIVLGGERIERGHRVDADEPGELFGHDTAANPVELLLSALGSCMSITCAANAAVMGIALEAVEVELAGELDLRGALGVDPQVRAGLAELTASVRIRSSAPRAQLEELVQSIETTSPVFDTVSRAVRVRPQLEIV